ncbi:flavin reductase family protein [Olsenella sp. Marseille-QA0557]|uniref:flavin reductase family protein n=1 Tax=Olsenella sp. Marseille-QA0557 TaxID=3378782 RepID=UPI003D13D80A
MDPKALFKFSSGLYVVAASHGDDVGACLINTGMQLTAEPLQVQVVINKENHTESVVREAGSFSLAVVSEKADMMFIGRFGFRSSVDFDKFGGIPCEHTSLGDPYTTECTCAMLGCKVVQTLDVGTHTLFVGEVVDAEVLSDDAPMTYTYYHTVLKGKTPAKASSYIPEG